MSDGTLLIGKRGAGKSLIAVHRMREKMYAGCAVATNLDLFVDKLISPRNKVRPYRLPDWPTAADMEALPLGNPGLEWDGGQVHMKKGYSEANNGLLVLDEAATFLNARTWAAKDRQDLINWLLQSRKFGWDLLFLAQHQRLIDAQMRDSLFDLVGIVRRLDKIAVPLLGKVAALVGFKLKMPRWHVGVLRYGAQADSPVAERVWVRGMDLFAAYNTTQKIDPAVGVKTGEGFQYLSAWDLRGRYMGWWEMNRNLILALVSISLVAGYFGGRQHMRMAGNAPISQAKPAEDKYATGVTGRGYFRDGGLYRVILSDGRTVTADAFRQTPTGWQARLGELWYRGEHQ